MKKFVCSVCGYVAEGKIPEECPVCHAKADKFVAMQEGKREWADQHVIGVAKDVDPEVVCVITSTENAAKWVCIWR